ncbi:hypothetical protein RRG08_039641 [Elysia crispata]|uniref:Uncharacterized protein n=1 Tax=Elysia crispata TaxID=231223 RepID=A0AAE0YAZ1_9GAST|nr:hypothetical protein RRG08_039641 [Elysia crispata]
MIIGLALGFWRKVGVLVCGFYHVVWEIMSEVKYTGYWPCRFKEPGENQRCIVRRSSTLSLRRKFKSCKHRVMIGVMRDNLLLDKR